MGWNRDQIIVCFAADGAAGSPPPAGDGGGAPPTAAASTPGAAIAAAAGIEPKPTAAATPPAWTKPDYLPDHLAGSSIEEALANTFKAFDGYRQSAAKRGEIPKDAAGYSYEPPPELAGYFRPNDPLMTALAPTAHKLGLSKSEYEMLVGGTLGDLVKAGALPPPFDATAELGKVQQALNLPATAEGKAELSRIVGDTVAFADALGTQLGLGDGPKSMLAALADTGEGLVALHAIRERLGTRGPQSEGRAAGPGAGTAADLKAMASDPRVDPKSPKYDERFREQYDADYRRIFGGK